MPELDSLSVNCFCNFYKFMSKAVKYILNTSKTKLKHKPNLLYFQLETTNTLEKESGNAGAIAGGVIGACVVLSIFAGILFLR